MKTNIISRIIIVTLAINFCISTVTEKCPTYSCDKILEKDLCSSKTVSETSVNYSFQKCTGIDLFCPYLSGDKTQCQTSGNILTRYAGSSCSDSNPCVASLKCVDNVCKGLEENTECNTTDQCLVGLACIKDNNDGKLKCTKQRVIGNDCTSSFECVNNAACNKITNKCTALFSLEVGTEISDLEMEFNQVSLCKSGFSREGKCSSLKLLPELVDKECNDDADCKYYENSKSSQSFVFLNDMEVTLHGSCQCGYNLEGKRYCKRGNERENNEPDFNSYVDYLKSYLENNSSKCHSMERFRCRNVIQSNRADFLNNERVLTNVYETNLFKGSNECIMKTVRPFFTVNQCPKFMCGAASEKNCVEGNGLLAEERTVNILPCKDTTSRCNYIPSNIFSNDNYVAECVKSSAPMNVLPGEKCNDTTECYEAIIHNDEGKETKVQECSKDRKVCVGAPEGKWCKSHKSCEAGLFCKYDLANPDNNKCAKQLTDKSACNSTEECNNDLLCFGEENKKVCTAVFSLPLGTKLIGIEKIYANFACASGYSHNERCALKKYSKDKHTVEKGLVKCNIESSCYYDILYKEDGSEKETLVQQNACNCGYNVDRQGYCPYSQHDEVTETLFKKKLNIDKANFSNKLHTANRDKGDINPDYPKKCLPFYVDSSYANSVECAQNVLGYGDCKEFEDSSSSEESSSSSSSNSNFINFTKMIVLIVVLSLLS